MVEAVVIFVIGLICGIAACYIRLRLMKKKVKMYESYIHRRLGETVPFVSECSRPHETEPPPKARESFPEADQHR